MFIGKIFGFFLGFLAFGPIGAILGVLIGHSFDKGLKIQYQSQGFNFFTDPVLIKQTFFHSVFTVMGHLAKADGRVSENEIQAARQVMMRMRLNEEDKLHAMRLFNTGKSSDFNLNQELDNLAKVCRGRFDLLYMFVEIQVQSACADGGKLHANEQNILLTICHKLGINDYVFYDLLGRHNAGFNGQRQHQNNFTTHKGSLSQAYATLGVKENAPFSEVKKAYRKLMSRYHPDKLVAKGLPDEMIQIAKEKTQEIGKAYDLIKDAKGN